MASGSGIANYQTDIVSTAIYWLRSQIRDKFRELRRIVDEREKALLSELATCNPTVEEYIPANVSQDTTRRRDSIVNGLTHRTLNDLSKSIPSSFEWDDAIYEAVKSIGNFTYCSSSLTIQTQDTSPTTQYIPPTTRKPSLESRDNLIVSVGKGGLAPGEFNVPRGLAIDPTTSNIYVADCVNNRVQAFSSDGEYLFHFGNNRGEVRMSNPWGICVTRQKIYVTQFRIGAVYMYKLDGTFVSKTGTRGTGPGQFEYPEGMTSDVDGNMIVCDRGNNRIQVLSGELNYLTEFGRETLKKPRDVKMVTEYIIVLDKSNPCLHVFTIRGDKSGVDHIQDMISQGQGLQVCKPTFFALDDNNCIVISDQWNHTVKSFSSLGEHNTDITSPYNLYRPQGIAYDATAKQIVCICWNQLNALQIFKLGNI